MLLQSWSHCQLSCMAPLSSSLAFNESSRTTQAVFCPVMVHIACCSTGLLDEQACSSENLTRLWNQKVRTVPLYWAETKCYYSAIFTGNGIPISKERIRIVRPPPPPRLTYLYYLPFAEVYCDHYLSGDDQGNFWRFHGHRRINSLIPAPKLWLV